MDLIHKFLNLVAPPTTFFSLCLLLPPYWTFKFFLSFINSIFSENVAGKVVHITGASSGIGEHLAYEYARRGARLALSARRETALREVADKARDCGSPDVIIMRADVSKVEDCSRLVDETVNHFGRLDHLVNNAAISVATLFEDADDITNLRPIMETNFWGSVYTTRFALPHLRKSRGKIVAMSSADSWMPAPRRNVYNASKAALVSMYETLRVEVGSQVGITIVTPGYVESEMTKGKFLLKEGKMDVDQDLRDVEVSAVAVESVSECAKAIVSSTLRGDRYLTVPAWFRMTYVIKMLCPEIVEWSFRMLYLTESRTTPAREAPSKKILDATGAKKLLYPSSIQSPDVKIE
ncbi:11-beta-hydroxysteroid dehydrogenase 1B-like [Abrus precatorius]|uniref:11-beta-hydroxysteroid dehydrogenase 1B-like n=1 Tax=Abrus precatorius TaxID=3816 RepID=A0A8B8KJ10_ABRPR|nr:11-beta-hydroxysteroid dehydrogenase 1B-like [Abrus precatorius]